LTAGDWPIFVCPCVAEITPDIVEQQAGVPASGARLADLDNRIDEFRECGLARHVGKEGDRSQLVCQFFTIINQVEYRTPDPGRPQGAALHSGDESLDGGFGQLSTAGDLESRADAELDVID